MQTNINVTVGDPISPITPTPNTTEPISAPNTGGLSNLFGDNSSTALILGLVALIIIIAISLIFITRKHHQKLHFKSKHFKLKPTIISGLALLFILSTITAFSYSKETNKPANAIPPINTLSVSIESVEKTISPNVDNGFGVAPSTITVSSNQYGYTLDMYATNGDLINTTNTTTTDKIKALDPASATTPTTLSNNTWGIALNQPTNPIIDENSAVFQYIPTDYNNPLRLKETDASTASDTSTTVYYGAKVDNTLTEGTYTDTINYIVVAKPAPVPTCQPNTICYNDNGANSPTTMSNQTINNTDTEVTLWASNFQYTGGEHGFAGWNTKADGTGTSFGPNQTIDSTNQIMLDEIKNNGLTLYAIWIKSTGNLQNWKGCSAMNIGDVTALTDTRDNNTYAVAKLADNRCWMIENLRLDGTAIITTTNTNNPLNNASTVTIRNDDGNVTDHLSPSSNSWCDDSSPACMNQSKLNAENTTNTVSTMIVPDANIYSYGNYYNWYSATAGNGTYNMTSGNTVGDICPFGWHLPTGGVGGEFSNLDIAMGGTGVQQNTTKDIKRWSAFPNNYNYSGFFHYTTGHSFFGRYWSSTADYNYAMAYELNLNYKFISPGTFISNVSTNGFSIRCLSST